MLTEEVFATYLAPLTPLQAEGVWELKKLINKYAPNLEEQIDNGKWYKGLITYKTPDGNFVYAVGPRTGGFTTFHMMPYYASGDLQTHYGAELKKFLSGKSCIQFKQFSDIPKEALVDIIKQGPRIMADALAQHKK